MTKKTSNNKSLLEKTVVASGKIIRYAIKRGKPDPGKPLLTTHGELAFMEQGVSTWKLELDGSEKVVPASPETPRVSVRAEWLNTLQALQKGLKVVHGGAANTFGGMGVLLLPRDFRIPTVLATDENVRYYGLELLDKGETFSVSSPKVPVALMRYRYGKDYRRDFLMKPKGGGGLFVETHDFPHLHVPMKPDCGGYIVIGKRTGKGHFHFTGFQIPYGRALYTPSNTIHGDGALVGEYAITVADSNLCRADTVLMYDRKTGRMAKDVLPDWSAAQER